MTDTLRLQAETSDKAVERSVRFLEALFEGRGPRDFSVRFWDGERMRPTVGARERYVLVLQHPGALRSMFVPPDSVSLGEAFIYGEFEVEGDLEAVFDTFDQLRSSPFTAGDAARLGALLLVLPANDREASRDAKLDGDRHSKRRDREAISFHYDVGNDFYSLWLGDEMVYSCAYFEEPGYDLDRAQHAKLEHICRKLRIQPGDRVLDIGCGWGGLMAHAARYHGAVVDGVTLSEEQAAYARDRFSRLGLGDRCRVELKDYREVNGRYDKITSVGMFEHVGAKQLAEYFGHVHDLLASDGLFLNHGISAKHGSGPWKSRSFINRYVFPDGELLPVSATLDAAEASGFEVRDVESLREHYAHTLRHWASRLEENREAAVRATDPVTYRIWRLYMTGAAHAFHTGSLGVHQALLAKSGNAPSRLPNSRADIYDGPAGERRIAGRG